MASHGRAHRLLRQWLSVRGKLLLKRHLHRLPQRWHRHLRCLRRRLLRLDRLLLLQLLGRLRSWLLGRLRGWLRLLRLRLLLSRLRLLLHLLLVLLVVLLVSLHPHRKVGSATSSTPTPTSPEKTHPAI
jgi:hypothetical protein